MRYCVTYRIDARYITEAEADSLQEALEKADEKYLDANFGEARDIDGEPVLVEDENEIYVWEK